MKEPYTNRELISDPWKALAANPNDKELEKKLLTLIFEDSMDVIKRFQELQDDISYSIQGTIVSNDFVSMIRNMDGSRHTVVKLTNGRTVATAKEYALQGKHVAILNFASATSPGGKVFKGSNAQEESICRISTLYPVLTSDNAKEYYSFHNKNIGKLKPYYSNTLIYSPSITVFKPDEKYPATTKDKGEWFHVDVITSAAPNLINQPIKRNMLEVVLCSRIDNILAAAIAGGADVVILGAFGCGVFKNPPDLVAKCFKNVISKYEGMLDVIDFAIINDGRGKKNFEEFQKVFN